MRRTVLCSLVFLSGCTGMGHFLSDTHSLNGNPNRPVGDSANIQRANGGPGQQPVITAATGDVWPTSIPAMPTLAEIQKQMDLSGPTSPLGGVPTPGTGTGTIHGPAGTSPGALPNAGTGAGAGLGLPELPPGSGKSNYATPAPDTMPKLGTTIQTPAGPTTVTGGTPNYQTVAPINGQGGGILIPNGNGTSTLVMPNGTISTINTPK
jgi:hypothetical protein